MSRLQFTKAAPTNNRAKVLIIGEAGKGKSHAALTFPKPAVIDAEGSIGWFSDRFQFESVATKSFADVRELLSELRKNPNGYETVIVDSLTTIYNSLTNATSLQLAAENITDFRPLDWGRIKKKFSSMLDELYYQVPLHVVCIGWIKTEYARPGSTVDGKKVRPNELVAIGELFDGDKKTEHAFDFIFKIDGNDGKATRATVIKSRSGALHAGQVIPDFGWKTLEPLFAREAVAGKRGMTDEEQAARDRALGSTDVNTTPYQVRLQSLKLGFRDAFGAQAKLSQWLEAEGIAPGLARRPGFRLTDAEMDVAFSRLLDVSASSIDDFDGVAETKAPELAPPPAPAVTLPPEILAAAVELGILPAAVLSDLARHGGNVAALAEEYQARMATMPRRTPPAVAEADRQHRLTAAQKAHAAFGHWLTRKYDHEGQLEFARKLFTRPQLASYNELTPEECETLTKTVREYQSANMPENRGDMPCPVCGVPIGAKHFRDCQAVAA